MKEVVYTFDSRGCYLPDKKAAFENESHIRLVIKPHDFELKISDEILRSSSCKGYVIEVSRTGDTHFYDYENNLLVTASGTEKEFAEVRFSWQQDLLTLDFGHMETVDNYPNCDGEYDRWSEKWVPEYGVNLNTATSPAEVFVRA